MLRKVYVMAYLLSFVIAMAVTSIAMAQENAEVTKIERVRWSGITLLGCRILGSWATAPAEPSLFGVASPYFRLNGDDKTVFRGLGRDSGFAQYVLPTMQSRKQLRDIVSNNELSRGSLAKFDDQVASGEKIRMVSSGLVFGGRTCVVSGIAMAIIGLGQKSSAFEDTPAITKAGYSVAVIGVYSWVAGIVGQMVGEVVAKQAFSHLSDSMEYYNKAQTPSQPQVSLNDRF